VRETSSRGLLKPGTKEALMWRKALVAATTMAALAGTAEAATLRGTVRVNGAATEGVSVFAWQHGGGYATVVHTGFDGVYEVWLPDHATYNLVCNKDDVPGHRGDLPMIAADNVGLSDADAVVNFDFGGAPPSSTTPSGIGVDDGGGVHGAIIDAFARNGGEGALGRPYDNGGGAAVHRWGGGVVQDVRGGAAGAGALMLRDGAGAAFAVTGGAWDALLARGGAEGRLGYPLGDAAGGRQRFEGGELVDVGGRWDDAPVAMAAPGVGVDADGRAHRAIVDAYQRLGGQATPYDNGGGSFVHAWGDGVVQDLLGGSIGRGAVMQQNGAAQAFVVAGGAWEAYLAAGGPESRAGYPAGDEANGRQPVQGGALERTAAGWTFRASSAATRAGAGFGLDLGGRTDGSAGFVDFIAGLNVEWVRVNFIRHRGGDWWRDYDALVDGLRARGVKIYGLINNEAMDEDQGPLQNGPWDGRARDYCERFAETCEQVVGHFRGRIGVYELINEPNNWNENRTARVHATWMAFMLQRAYERVKLDHAGDASWQVTLVSGAVFSFTDNDSAGYLRDVWNAGRRDHGWDVVRARCGRFPVDGVGYHIYVLEGAGDRPDEVAGVYARHLDAVESFLRSHDPEADQKKIWMSEYGWRSDLGEERQADMLEAAFDALGADPRVAVALAFALQDFVLPSGLEAWGLLRTDGSEKATLDRFRRYLASH
jgi:hypothetical protein